MAGEGVGWLKISRLKKLMEDENYRNIILAKMNRTIDRKMTPDDHVDDVVSLHFKGTVSHVHIKIAVYAPAEWADTLTLFHL